MSEPISDKALFESISQVVKGHYYGKDDDVHMWEYQLSAAEVEEANRILVEHGLESADKIYLGRETEQGEQANQVTTEINNINLDSSGLIRYYHFTKHGGMSEVIAEKDIMVDGDSTDLRVLLRSWLGHTDPHGGLSEYHQEMKQIELQERFALSALVQLLKSK